MRVIFHCDCNNFFASCESIDHPEYKTVPMAVAGDPELRVGVVVAKNDLAKKFGVKTTDTVWQARQKCPQILFVRPSRGLYSKVSEQVNAIYREYTDLVEPASIDESYLDLTQSPEIRKLGLRGLADLLRKRVREEIGITISVGASYNKTFAKIGSDYRKPDATTVILPENYRRIVWPLPVTDMMYIGKASAKKLVNIGIRTIGDLAAVPAETLVSLLGKGGDALWRNANGLDDDPVVKAEDQPEIKSVSRGHTFPRDLVTAEEVRQGMAPMVETVCGQLRKHDMKGNVVTLQIKSPDLEVISRQVTLTHWTNVYSEVLSAAMGIFERHWTMDENHPIRAFTVGVSGLVHSSAAVEQLSMLDDPAVTGREKAGYQKRENQEKVEAAIDRLKARMGESVFGFGKGPAG